MEMIYLHEREEQDRFARKAAAHFEQHPEHWSYTDGDIRANAYFALRYGLGKDCVVVFKIGEDQPTNYMNLINMES